MSRAEVLLPAGAQLGEGPLWDECAGDIVWVDILAKQVIRTNMANPDRRDFMCGEPVGSLALTATGGLVGATPTGLRRLDVDEAPYVGRFPVPRPDLRSNDGKAAPGGRFVVGTMSAENPVASESVPVEGCGSLWSFGGKGPSMLVDSTTISNGLAWSADGRVMFHIDTPTRRIMAYDYDPNDGTISAPRLRFEVEAEAGAPDGMCIDAEGGLWIALWGGSAVRRYMDDVLDEIVEVPTPLVTCPAFVGTDLTTLVITTAAEGLSGMGGAGHVYVCTPDVKGAAVPSLGPWADTWA